MAGNILYFFYSGFVLVAWMAILVIFAMKKDVGSMKKVVLVTTPLVVLCGFYFWNGEFNNVVKSYMFSSKAFECDYTAELTHLSIPLPNRTVFMGKENACSPFYLTYADEKTFTDFYEEELGKMRINEDIQTFHPVEQGFMIELSSGSTIDILLDEDDRLLSIDYKQK
ncbi:hypothetical protein ACFFSY_01925 [Paenibacillus aurantiacus]|uniref:Uncharacterized protein n=1 Tax=Paenibacillus aurantiacus TaxID=1936118 RepID=A0ABV5KHJ4_9BACL